MEVITIKVKFLLFAVLLVFISLAMAQPSGLISNVLQGQTQVLPAQPIIIGGSGGGGLGGPKETGVFYAPSACVAGCPFNITINSDNPNNYTVMGTLYINFSYATLTPVSAQDISVASNNPAILLVILETASPATNSTLFHIYPVSASYKFLMPTGTTKNVIDLAVDFSTPGNYTWTLWMGT